MARPAPLSPERLPELDPAVLRAWVADVRPDVSIKYDLQWVYETQRGRVRGRGAVRFAPPDSLRFDYRAPFGRSGAAVMIGDTMVWAEPQEDVETLIPVVPLFWTALGLPQTPPPRARVFGAERESVRVWRFRDDGFEQTYMDSRGQDRRLQMDLRRGDEVVGAVTVTWDSSGAPSTATITFPNAAARFRMTVSDVEHRVTLDPAVWREP